MRETPWVVKYLLAGILITSSISVVYAKDVFEVVNECMQEASLTLPEEEKKPMLTLEVEYVQNTSVDVTLLLNAENSSEPLGWCTVTGRVLEAVGPSNPAEMLRQNRQSVRTQESSHSLPCQKHLQTREEVEKCEQAMERAKNEYDAKQDAIEGCLRKALQMAEHEGGSKIGTFMKLIEAKHVCGVTGQESVCLDANRRIVEVKQSEAPSTIRSKLIDIERLRKNYLLKCREDQRLQVKAKSICQKLKLSTWICGSR